MSDILFELPEIMNEAQAKYEKMLKEKKIPDLELIEKMNEGDNLIVRADNAEYMLYLLMNGYEGMIDMIYVDPPFFSKADYSIKVKVGTGNRRLTLTDNHAFTDKWESGMYAYLESIALRLLMMKGLLSDTGSLFLHLDWHSSHYMKIIADHIFGENNFINEIVWNYKSGGVSKRYFARKHDVILFYAKTKNYFFRQQKEKSYNRGMKPYRFKGVKEYKDDLGWYTLVSMKDVWQIDMVGRTSSERTGYATQKPETLIKRIMESVTQDGDLCADFYCGSGTLGAACTEMNRRYIMCDNSTAAVMMAHKRMVQLGSPHELMSEKTSVSHNLNISIGLTDVEGIIEGCIISLDNMSYNDLDLLGVKDENRDLLETILNNHFSQLIEYWCVDCNYDGSTVRPLVFFSRDKGDIETSVNIPKSQIKKLAVKIMDVFGNETIVGF